ncbi:MAG: peptidoglycan-associated lipoprotein Pal [Bdellovibrionota bacterium]
MRRVRFVLLVLLTVSLFACSSSKGGQSRPGDELDKAGDGNIPLANAGSELTMIHFSYDSSSLSSQAQGTLRDDGKWLNDNPAKKVQIEGHCDERGTNEYNLALGERRARAAYDYLRSLGVKKEQMSTISYGEELPLDPGHDESAYEKNRRAQFRVK